MRLNERRRRQRAFLQLVGTKQGESEITATLASLPKMPPSGADESYVRMVVRYEQELNRMILDIDRSVSARQRSTAVVRLHRFARDLRGWRRSRSDNPLPSVIKLQSGKDRPLLHCGRPPCHWFSS